MQNFPKLDGLQTVSIIAPNDLEDYEQALKILKKKAQTQNARNSGSSQLSSKS